MFFNCIHNIFLNIRNFEESSLVSACDKNFSMSEHLRELQSGKEIL